LAYLCLWGVMWDRLSGRWERVALPLALLACCLVGLGDLAGRTQAGPPALAQAAEHLRAHARPGDVVEVSGAVAVNRLRYYLAQCQARSVVVRSRVSLLSQNGHMVHQFSLSRGDMILDQARERPAPGQRVWYGADGQGGVPFEGRPLGCY